MLNVNNVQIVYDNVIEAVRDASLSVDEGQIVTLLGSNGAGKSTILKGISGVLYPEDGDIIGGTITLNGESLIGRKPDEIVRSGVVMVPEGRQLFEPLTVEENLLVGLEAAPGSNRRIPPEVLGIFPVLQQMLKRMGGDLSGGQQQQLAIARALAGNPRVLLLDEPTEGIQPNIIQHIGEVLSELANVRGVTIVLVEQYLDFVREFGHDFYIMNRGRVVAEGETGKLTDELVSEYLSV